MSPAARKGLGRGLASLVPGDVVDRSTPGLPTFQRVPMDGVRRNPEQPRGDFDPEGLDALAESIRTLGVLQPVLVRRDDDGFVLLAGERRWRAAGRAGLTHIPALICPGGGRGGDLLVALVENLQREDLNPLEEAMGFKALTEVHGLTQEEVARRVGRDRTTVTNSLRLLKLPPVALEALRDGRITAGHGKALLSLRDPERLGDLLRAVEEGTLSVRATEKLVERLNQGGPPRRDADPPRFGHAENLLARSLGAQVQIRSRQDGGGRIVIQYGSEEELTALVERIRIKG